MHLLFLSSLLLLLLFVDVVGCDAGGDGAAGIQSIMLTGLKVGCGVVVVVVVDTATCCCCDQSSPSLSTTTVLEEVADSTMAAAACPLGGRAEDGAPGLGTGGGGVSLSIG